ncbi:phenylacetate--CoA ligase family protein [uncultured Jatrophihabitans sp.]|uniref:phenylacetate--CoA ligase family protein n=1 Tax=uncultured Jatrophihabitans sp. TaxID=1610747 RepID=UPI0035CB7432
MEVKRAVFDAKAALALRPDRRVDDQLRTTEVLDPEVLQNLQAERSAAHARFAMQTTPFYRELYTAAGFTVDDLKDPAAFTALPLVTKSDVREQPDRFRSSEATDSNAVMSATGGSTGEPLHLLRDLRTPTRTLEWRLFRWWGVHPSDNIAIVQRKTKTGQETRRHNAVWWPSKRIRLDAFRMTDDSIREFFAAWERVGPRILMGYVGAIAELADFCVTHAISLSPPKAIAVTAAPLMPAQRQAIEEAFGAPVYDHYRSAEVPWLAGECREQNGLHTFADLRRVEVLAADGRAAGADEVGEVVATDLTNRVFPLIRYRMGDRTSAIAQRCACGVTLPRIRQVAGRVTETLRLPNGQIIVGDPLGPVFSRVPHPARKYQLHQHADYSIVVRCVPNPGARARADVDAAIEELRSAVGHQVPVRLEIVEQIGHDGGKIRFITSELA